MSLYLKLYLAHDFSIYSRITSWLGFVYLISSMSFTACDEVSPFHTPHYGNRKLFLLAYNYANNIYYRSVIITCYMLWMLLCVLRFGTEVTCFTCICILSLEGAPGLLSCILHSEGKQEGELGKPVLLDVFF